MSKTKITTAVIILMLFATSIFAKSPQSDLQQTIKSHIAYPENFIKEQIEGSVFVEFTVNENGKIEVLNSNSISGDLMVYVVDELSSITVLWDPVLAGQKFTMRFDFKLE
jgi:hypothetical protein